MEKDHSNMSNICAILHLLAESYRDNIDRSAASANDNTVSLLDKFQIIAKAFIWTEQADRFWTGKNGLLNMVQQLKYLSKYLSLREILATNLLLLTLSSSLPLATHSNLQLYSPLYTPEGACMWDTGISAFNVNTSPTSDRVSASIYKEKFKTYFLHKPFN